MVREAAAQGDREQRPVLAGGARLYHTRAPTARCLTNGGSISTFISQDSEMTNDLTEINDKKVAFTGFAGLAGRFDLGGSR